MFKPHNNPIDTAKLLEIIEAQARLLDAQNRSFESQYQTIRISTQTIESQRQKIESQDQKIGFQNKSIKSKQARIEILIEKLRLATLRQFAAKSEKGQYDHTL